jgi:Zn-dependent protease with chaperone function
VYYALGIAILFAGFFAAHGLLAAVAAGGRSWLDRNSAALRPSVRARLWFALIVTPALGGTIFSASLLISYLLFEPRHTNENIGWLLALGAVLGAGAWVRAGWKLISVRLATRSLIANWEANAVSIAMPGWERRAYRLDHAFPLIAVVGVRQPRLFVAGQVLEQLEPDELAVAVAHEYGHLTAHDNFKRIVADVCGGLAWWVPGGDALRRLWIDASELAADEFAVAGSLARPVNLASALVKLARMAPAGTRPAMPAGAFLIESAGDILSQRVGWLLNSEQAEGGERGRMKAVMLVSGVAVVALVTIALQLDLFSRLHQLIEVVVQ